MGKFRSGFLTVIAAWCCAGYANAQAAPSASPTSQQSLGGRLKNCTARAHCRRMLRFFKQLLDKPRCNHSKPRGVPVLPFHKRQSINGRLVPNGSMVDFSMRHTLP